MQISFRTIPSHTSASSLHERRVVIEHSILLILENNTCEVYSMECFPYVTSPSVLAFTVLAMQ